jgi:hypothetical protein
MVLAEGLHVTRVAGRDLPCTRFGVGVGTGEGGSRCVASGRIVVGGCRRRRVDVVVGSKTAKG